jgi:hypothetical protein
MGVPAYGNIRQNGATVQPSPMKASRKSTFCRMLRNVE